MKKILLSLAVIAVVAVGVVGVVRRVDALLAEQVGVCQAIGHIFRLHAALLMAYSVALRHVGERVLRRSRRLVDPLLGVRPG